MTTHLNVRPDGVAVIQLDNPPVNSLASTLTESFSQHMNQATKDPNVKAIVVTGKGAFFCGGAAIDEFNKPTKSGSNPLELMHECINVLDSCPKVTVAAINGQALGGGCEVTLGCHYRVAHKNAKIGTPEVKLGLLPGAQGTQRIPRLTDIQTAITMILTGNPLTAEKALKAKIVDEISDGDIVEDACVFALMQKKTRPISKIVPSQFNKDALRLGAMHQALDMAKKTGPKGMIAPAAIAECIKAALTLPFEKGCQVEMEQFFKLITSTESAAMRHLFFAERAASKVAGLTSKPAEIKKVGIVGAGLMGGGIAMCFINKGIPVVLKDAKQEWLDAGMQTISKNYEISVAKKRMKPTAMKQRLSLLTPTIDYAPLKDCDIIIEAVPEIMALKKDIFQELGKVVGPNTLVCTNTSGLNIDEIAESIPNPSRVMGTHFFSPANVMQLLENVKTAKAEPRTIATCMHMGKIINKKAVLVGNCDGFVGNRMIAPYGAEARLMIEEGAAADRMDQVVVDFGMAMGPMSMGDLVGHELFYKLRKQAGNMQLDTKTFIGPYEVTDWLVEQGRLGQKSGRGIYMYDSKTRKKQNMDPEILEVVKKIQQQKGVTPRKFDDNEIIERLFFPLVNEGFKILDEGFVGKPSDIDIVYVYGYGFPPVKGGPMFWADNYIGLDKLLERLRFYDEEARKRYTSNKNYRPVSYFKPSKLLEECVAQGKTLTQVWAAKNKQKQSKL
eukprot:GEMP01010095.1.p1 GENE.GEMP01010095.1~~GEMP01010095.1.p1  ORF type:complete len:728 (+),score=166.84 GEMP01010095.1:180-2363(+)